MASNSSNIRGKKPPIHAIAANQATQETNCSMTLAQAEPGNTLLKTRALKRIIAKLSNMGTAILTAPICWLINGLLEAA